MVCDPLPDGVDSLVSREEVIAEETAEVIVLQLRQDYSRDNPDRIFPLPYEYWRYVPTRRNRATGQ